MTGVVSVPLTKLKGHRDGGRSSRYGFFGDGLGVGCG